MWNIAVRFFFIALFWRMEFCLLELKLKLKSYSGYKPWSILRYAVGLTNANKKHTWNETAIIIIIMSWSIGTVYTKPWFWRKVFIASFFSSFSPLLSLIIAKEWVHLHFFVILPKKYTQHNCITKFEHLQMFMSVRLIVKYANTSTTMSKYSIWTVINEY